MADQRIRIAVFGNATFIDKDQPRCDFLCKADFMGDDDHRHAFFSQILHHLQDFMTEFRVQRRGRLIEKHHLGLNRQRAGNRDTLHDRAQSQVCELSFAGYHMKKLCQLCKNRRIHRL
ncbi:Hypothetical Protein PANA_1281 [Pantoea ananatis LMG 20103]|uniref:Uncharacterized protein n=1 Tax=Pantoea ananatis (strain LMG 20103) TaxID=706191 RepID=D4GN97_PANAM|nr:Hypothetical Protein PANA_1281 [Pantoea ananatis LMG 20103]